jgi:predicted TPR repeat methyltransferase
MATLTAESSMLERVSKEYVKSLFDSNAQNYEDFLVREHGYTGFERLRLGFDRVFEGGNTPRFDLVVDAGCGTGLVGVQFRNISTTLVGVDLSEVMVKEAIKARPGLYDDMVVGDVTQVFRELSPISLIVAGDSYNYFGDLDPLFESMKDSLVDNGYTAFTLENVRPETEQVWDESEPAWQWRLTESGRFAHRKDYVVSIGLKHGLVLVHYEAMAGASQPGPKLVFITVVSHTTIQIFVSKWVLPSKVTCLYCRKPHSQETRTSCRKHKFFCSEPRIFLDHCPPKYLELGL